MDFRSFDPPTLDTFAAGWLRTSRRKMRQALRAARFNDLPGMWCGYGEADAAVSVLYDVGHPRAYGALRTLARVRRVLESRMCLQSSTESTPTQPRPLF
jgi:hypothetical protein